MSERSQLRANQLINTFGPGAMVDLPTKAVIIAGLHGWNHGKGKEGVVHEPRLAAKVARLLQPPRPTVELRAPPTAEDLRFKKGQVQPAVDGYVFPHWFIVQKSEKAAHARRRRRLVHRGQLNDNSKFQDPDDKKHKSVVPVRFVRACRHGHVGDIHWRRFVHRGDAPCLRELWIEERGTSGELSENWILCECGVERCLGEAADRKANSLGTCNGSRPWLDDHEEGCAEPNWLLLRNASNAYFPHLLTVISIPDAMAAVEAVVLKQWEHLQFVKTAERLGEERQKKAIAERLAPFGDDELLAVIQRVRTGAPISAVERPVKAVEFDALAAAKREAKTDEPDRDFFAKELDPARWGASWLSAVAKVVLVHRLREVSALVGFTRFDAGVRDISGELDVEVRRASLHPHPSWMPAVENRGEGVFIQFRSEAIAEWEERKAVQARNEVLAGGFHAWLASRGVTVGGKAVFPGAAYTMLHSLSHLLIAAISLECGYPASSLRERIYAPEPGGKEMEGCYGILLLTGSGDAQGTLGGLVHSARDIRRHLARACQLGALCSNDPVCSAHVPAGSAAEKLSGSACHGCLYVSETSCEQWNHYLDRSLVVSTVERLGCEFFHDLA